MTRPMARRHRPKPVIVLDNIPQLSAISRACVELIHLDERMGIQLTRAKRGFNRTDLEEALKRVNEVADIVEPSDRNSV